MSVPSHVIGENHVPLLQLSIGTALRQAASRFPHKPAICSLFQGCELTYAELDQLADRVAKSLIALGIQQGDRVAIWSANRWEWLAAHHGIVRIGAIVVTVNPAFRAEEVRYVLDDAGVKLLIAAPAFRGFSFVQAIEEIRGNLPALEHVVLFDGVNSTGDTRKWEKFLEPGRAIDDAHLDQRASAVYSGAPCHLQYTSGTTGRPKGALLTHHGILNNGYFVGLRQRLSENDSICLPVPFFHCFGIVLGALAAVAHGTEIVLPGESFEPRETLAAVEARKCTSLYAVPMMFISMLSHPELKDIDLNSLRTGAIGAAPCPHATMTEIIETMNMKEITVVYGMTETSPISFQTRATDSTDVRVSTVGVIQPHLEAKIIDPDTGNVVAFGLPGELCVRGYSVMKGYWQAPELTGQAIDSDGWMHSGDLAVMQPSGYVEIVGRLKDVIIRGGENIYPREVEEYLITIPDVLDAYVFGMPDDKYGEEVCAWVRLQEGSILLPQDIFDLCKGKIATYKIPRLIRIVEEFPTTASGKAQKFKMREFELELRGVEMA
ncbi:AMP-binding protein [Bosea sp. F3-2]|uniref:AMP-binding protein n=1 Tax=Bosea sp. F3-2 TaxID=2599640 RepID=UPI0011ED1F30|nr:AMP-binding protein [Bosea sp. F3-2]QEL22890.1 AMP-binding protein [Bosea sp. F3-2]